MMKKIFIGVAVLIALIMIAKKSKLGILEYLVPLLKDLEKFSSNPYWDIKQWSWGYGTKVPNSVADKNVRPNKTINQATAIIDLTNHVWKDYNYLNKLIKVPLLNNQWAALLSFSYNLGSGNADNLVDLINAKDWDGFSKKFLLYNRAGGKFSKHHAERRKKELDLFFS